MSSMLRFGFVSLAVPTLLTVCSPAGAQQHQQVEAQDGSGVVGYKDTPLQPWSGFHTHAPDRPKPPKVTPAALPLNQEIFGHTPHCGLASYDRVPAQGPIALGAHHCPVRFRNIWIRSLQL